MLRGLALSVFLVFPSILYAAEIVAADNHLELMNPIINATISGDLQKMPRMEGTYNVEGDKSAENQQIGLMPETEGAYNVEDDKSAESQQIGLSSSKLLRGSAARKQRARAAAERFQSLKSLAHERYLCPIDRIQVVEDQNIRTTTRGKDEYERSITDTTNAAYHVGYFTGLQDKQTSIQPKVKASFEVQHPEKLPFRAAWQHFFSDIDGRAQYGVLGAPGGDLGIFLIALSAIEHITIQTQGQLSYEQVNDYFQQFLGDMGTQFGKQRFAMIMDESSLQRLASLAEVVDALHPVSSEGADRVKSMSGEPAAIGSEHLRLIVNPVNPGYHIRPELAQHLIKAFWNLFFDTNHPSRPKLIVPIMQGDHEEKGVIVSSRADGDYVCNGQSPLFVPHVETSSYYIYHQGATHRVLEGLSHWVAKVLRYESPSVRNQIHQDMLNIENNGWKSTIETVAHGLERFTLKLTSFSGW